MQSQKPFFDDLARVASGALGALSGLRAEMEAMVRQQFERVTTGLDMVPREEFEVVRAMAAKAREQQEILEERVKALETRLAASEKPKTPASPKTPVSPKPKAAPKPKA
ncbi:hypothetical protein CU669_06415 [Paramagnetospirillum kuznetsovii]|uniref:Pyrroline-5-carboxylate reductase n=1 Tax=Paramagnetospirillum kuznetsovii TaxID=2053833 RepID=A0A364P0Z6_9PROT|nr:accessory factor UbiK family protein [Paramagnetospirillum kuznetsovii]RAU23004.1 hypothetical protein CU669_06415 [Paramagnetospirillum kuznetsovii]